MFPIIKHIDDLLPFVLTNPQIRVKDGIDGYKIVSYQVQDEDTFAGEHEHFERECRGITFDAEGNIASRTLHKFFNVGQRDGVHPHELKWQDVTRIMVKRDGSMVTPVLVPSPQTSPIGIMNGMFMFKTKNSFITKEASLAEDVCDATEGGAEWIRDLLRAGATPTFEITSPKYPIVLTYEKDELTLLHIRDNVTGLYWSEDALRASHCPFPIVENVLNKFIGDGLPQNLVSWDKLYKYAMEAEGVEGVVIQFGQDMVKLKTKWYCDLHHSVTFTRWRDIARTVAADQSDDLKGAFTLTGRSIEPIVFVENKIKEVIAHHRMLVDAACATGRAAGMDVKAMALNLKGHELFGLIMRAFRNQEVNWMEWYEKNRLDDDWSLEVVPSGSGAAEEA